MEKSKLLSFIKISIILILIFSNIFISVSSEKVWRHKSKELWFNYTLYSNDWEFKINKTYDKVNIFFNECKTPEDFYERMQKYVKDAYKEGPPDLSNSRLYLIVDEVSDNNATLHCIQQSNLLLAGIKAIFCNFSNDHRRYFLKEGYGDFEIEIWRSFDLHPPILPYRSHIQIVIDMWNGSDTFLIENKTVDKIEIDTWEDEFRAFNKRDDCLLYPFFPAKINSILYTKNI